MKKSVSTTISNLIKIAFFIFSLSTPFFSSAQKSKHPDAQNCDEDGYCWGENRDEGKDKFAIYSDRFSWGEEYWESAEEPLTWLVTNIPYLHESLYINGYKIYNFCLKKAETDERKTELEDKILALLDNRYKYFGNSLNVLSIKGSKAYPYLIDRGNGYYKSLFELYTGLYDLQGTESKRYNLQYYMASVALMKQSKEIEEAEVFGHYEKIMNAIDFHIESETEEEEVEKWKEAGKKVDELLVKVTDINCEKVDEFFAEKILAHPEDGALNKRALKYYALAKCYDNPNFITAAKGAFNAEPTAGMASIIARSFASDKNYKEAEEWYQKSISLAKEDPIKAAKYYLTYAKILSKGGQFTKARSMAYEAASLDKQKASEAYSLIGDMYMHSGETCKNADPVKQRTIYLVAYDAYAKAGNSSKMSAAKEQFPSIQDIFTAGLEEGSEVEVGCWIGGTTVLRRR